MTELISAPEAAPEKESEGETEGRYQSPVTGSISRWALQTPGIDVFWPVLAIVLTTFVVLVATVAHSSMAAVGIGNPRTDWTAVATPASDKPFVIVQVSSNPTRAVAQAKAEALKHSGLNAGVLRSDRYEPLNKGWYVVYVGPFEATADGRAKAEAITDELKGSLVRTVHRR